MPDFRKLLGESRIAKEMILYRDFEHQDIFDGLRELMDGDGLCGRYGADRFMLLRSQERRTADYDRFAAAGEAKLDRTKNTVMKWGVYEVTDAAVSVEQMCDQIELELQGHFPGCSFPFRYSPGYGDLPLELQNPLLDLLDAPRRVGLCASASHILTPRKSVTAILGAADGPIQPTVRSCLGCPARESCQYRKSGGHCGIS